MKRIKDNGLTIAMFVLFLLSYIGMAFAGYNEFNEEQQEHGQPQVSVAEYFRHGEFWEGTFENWESEFLQMGIFVVLTAVLIQKGSSESKKPDEENPQDREPDPSKKDAPGPVKKGGISRRLYENSLTISLFLLFAISIALHGAAGAKEYNDEQEEHHQPRVSVAQFVATPTFWYQSFQNWQSEFLSIGVLGILSIYLRQKGSAQSKPVDAPHEETGD